MMMRMKRWTSWWLYDEAKCVCVCEVPSGHTKSTLGEILAYGLAALHTNWVSATLHPNPGKIGFMVERGKGLSTRTNTKKHNRDTHKD